MGDIWQDAKIIRAVGTKQANVQDIIQKVKDYVLIVIDLCRYLAGV